jgi:hypothetical protein
MGIGELLIGLGLVTAAVSAGADTTDVVAVKNMSTGTELYRFDVRVRHAAPDGNTMTTSGRW